MSRGQVLYFYDNGTRLPDVDSNVTPEYALAASKQDLHLCVEWTNHSDPNDVREFRGGRRVSPAGNV